MGRVEAGTSSSANWKGCKGARFLFFVCLAISFFFSSLNFLFSHFFSSFLRILKSDRGRRHDLKGGKGDVACDLS